MVLFNVMTTARSRVLPAQSLKGPSFLLFAILVFFALFSYLRAVLNVFPVSWLC
jgi:hypothetical protein